MTNNLKSSKTRNFPAKSSYLTSRFPELEEAASTIQAHSVILDCEGVCFHPEKNRLDFGMFDTRAKLINPSKIATAMNQSSATLIPFDVISVNGRSLCAEQLFQRKKHLSDIVSNGPAIMLPTYFIGDGQSLFDWTLANQWEGIVAKHVSSTYRINRRSDRLFEA